MQIVATRQHVLARHLLPRPMMSRGNTATDGIATCGSTSMKNLSAMTEFLRPAAAGIVLAALAMPAGALDLKTANGDWTFSFDGNVNVDYVFSSCQNPNSAIAI